MLRLGYSPTLSPWRDNRRAFLQAGGAGLLGLTVPKLLAAEAAQQAASSAANGRVPGAGRAKSVIFLFLFGGPSQLETFDMKPDAPAKIRGPFRPTPCRTPGLVMCEHLPQLATMSNKFCVIRTLTHDYNDHSGSAYCMQTGRRWHIPLGAGLNPTPKDYPSIGSIVKYVTHKERKSEGNISPYVVLPNQLGKLQEKGDLRRPGEYASWLGHAYNPLTTRIEKRDPKDVPFFRDCTDDELKFQLPGLSELPELQLERIQTRASLQAQLDDQRRAFDRTHDVTALDQMRQQALGMITSQKTNVALDIRRESPKTRDAYGRHLFGQSTLMARRLVEAGARFVTVHYDMCNGESWDSHSHSDDVKKFLLPSFDQTCSALLADLEQRGLLEETLVVAVGDLGRSPFETTPQWGRAHWCQLFPALVAGAGVRGGIVHGSSDKDAAYLRDHPVTPEDFAATLYHALGIDPHQRITTPDGRPSFLVEGGKPVVEIFG